MDLSRVGSHLPQVRHPCLQLRAVVQVSEFLSGADALLLPGLLVTSMEPDHGQRRGYRDHRRDTRGEALGFVDRHVSESVALEELEDPLTALLLHPGDLPKLDGDRELRTPLALA